MKHMYWLLALAVGMMCGCDSGGSGGNPAESQPVPGSAASSFSGTYVPAVSVGGVQLGDTYAAVKAAHGKPDSFTTPSAPQIGVINYGPTTPWGIQIVFSDTDGNGQFSDADTVVGITGSDFNRQGIFKYLSVGTGSTAAEIVARFGQPPASSPENLTMEYLTGNGTFIGFGFSGPIGDSGSVANSVDVGTTINK